VSLHFDYHKTINNAFRYCRKNNTFTIGYGLEDPIDEAQAGKTTSFFYQQCIIYFSYHMAYNPESLRKKARELLGQNSFDANPEIFDNIEKLIEEYNIHKIELELQQDELSRNNRELEYKNRRLDDLFENAPVGYFILDSKGMISDVNATATYILQKPKELIQKKPFTKFIHASSQDHFYFYWQKVMAQKQPTNIELALSVNNNEPVYFLVNSLPYQDSADGKWYVRLSATNVSELKEADVLRDSERRYRLLFKNMINGLLVLKPVFDNGQVKDFLFFRANAAFELITGISPLGMEGAPLLHIFPDSAPEIMELLRQTVIMSTNQKIENFPVNNYTYVNFYSFVPEKDYVALIIEDVTAKVLAENERKKSEELLRTIFKILPVGVTVTDINGNIIDCNPASEELLGLKRDEHLIRNFASKDWKIIRTDMTKMPIDEFASVRALKDNKIVENVEMGMVKKPGEITWVNVSAAPIPLKDMGVAIVYSDITERVQAQEETEEKFKNIIQNSTDAIIIVSQLGSIIEWNKGCEIIFGYKRKQVIGQKIWTFVEKVLYSNTQNIEESMFGKNNIQNALRTGDSEWFKKINEIVIKDSCSKSKTLQSVGFPVKSAQGYLLGVVARDISEAKNVENMLKDAKEKAEEASYIKSQFLANISHEIRTPLNAIMGFTEILREYKVTDTKFKSHLSGIEKSSKALMALINDILDLSRIEAGKMSLNPSPFNISELVEDVKQIFSLKAGQKGLALTSEIMPGTPLNMLLDELRLRQILFNLVGNAVKFTEKGSIRVTLQTRRKTTLNNAVDITLRVIDTGPGISQKDLNEIFNPFFQKQPHGTQKQEGTGLGLAISRRFVEMMNGKIAVNSTPGKGTEFVVFIPSVSVLEEFAKDAGKTTTQASEKNLDFNSHKELTDVLIKELVSKFGSVNQANDFMRKQIWSEYDKIADILGFDEVISFSSLLNGIAEKENLKYLKEFALMLSHEANSFNVIEINRLLSSFETLRSS